MKLQQSVALNIDHRITKVNGQVGFKKYKRGKILGVGAFAKCYECLNVESQKNFAVKAVSKKALDSDDKRQKVLSEIKIHKTLHHDHIVKFDNAFEDSDFIYMIVELCQNQTLLDLLIKRKKLTLQETRYYMLQIIQAVEYMHSKKFIHRDLKLANIFLNHDMQVKVGDFGEATKLQFADEKRVSVCGTLNYLAPEIISGPFGHSYEVDFWAIGVICYAMLFGKSPFQSKDQQQTLDKIKKCKYEFPSSLSVPSNAKDFIKRVLVLEPKDRMTIKEMLSHSFLSKQDIPKSIPVKSLVTVPSFESTKENSQSLLNTLLFKAKSNLRLVSKDFTKSNPLRQVLTPKPNRKSTQDISFCSSKKSMQNQEDKVNVTAFLDLTKKYGFGYLIGNEFYGVYFNDGSIMSCNEKKEKIYFVKNPNIPSARIQEYTNDRIPCERDFQKKYLLLDRFISLLNIQMLKTNQVKSPTQVCEKFVYVKEWWKNSQGTMFSLSNDQFQVSFTDGSNTVIHPAKKTFYIKSNEGKKTSFDKMDDALNSTDHEIKKRAIYTKQILSSIQKKKTSKLNNLRKIDSL